MTNKDKLEYIIFNLSRMNYNSQMQGGYSNCPVCDGVLNYWLGNDRLVWASPTQKAHFISNSPTKIKKFGKHIIDHPYNWTLVCSLKCNNAVQVGNAQPVLQDRIKADILAKS